MILLVNSGHVSVVADRVSVAASKQVSLECSQDRQFTDGTGAIETFAQPNKQKVEHDIVKKALLVAAGCGHIEVGALLSSLEITALETFQAMLSSAIKSEARNNLSRLAPW